MAKNFDDLLDILTGRKHRPLFSTIPDVAPADATATRTIARPTRTTDGSAVGPATKGNTDLPSATVQSKYQPRYDKAINFAIDNLPPVFAARNGMEAAKQLNSGHPGSAALTAALTFLSPEEIPGVGGAVKKLAGKLPAAALLRDIGETESVGTNARLLQEANALRNHPALYTAAGPYGALPSPTAGHPEVQSILREMQATSGGRNLPRVTAVDPERGRQMARAYAQLPTNDPAARGSYEALNAEVAAQKKRLEDAGFKFEFVDHDPYKNSKEMMDDVANTKTLKVYKTQGDQTHPFMTNDQNNDFRGVHDLLAHAGEAHQFGPKGEENAFRVHASTLSQKALPALAAETRGQNSFVNFGPNSHLPVSERPFAPQKAALFPDHLLGDYSGMGSPHSIPGAGQEFGILTAENPNGTALDAESNAQRNQALEKELAKRGHAFTPVKGSYTDPETKQTLNENSYLVHGLTAPHAEELGRLFGQNGVVTHQGYHDLAAGTLHPTSGISSTKDLPYTELPDGQRFTSGIDWSTSTPIAKSAAQRDAEGAGLRTVPNISHDRNSLGELMVSARHPSTNELLGYMHFGEDAPSKISDAFVEPAFRRQGIASALADHAEGILGEPVQHSETLSPHGKSFADGYDRAKGRPATARIDTSDPAFKVQADSAGVDWAAKHAPGAVSDASKLSEILKLRVPPSLKSELTNTSLRQRNEEIDRMLGHLEQNHVPWTPTERGVFDRTGFDPDHRMLQGTNTMPEARGSVPWDAELADRLDDPKLRKQMSRQVNLGLGLGGRGFYNSKPIKSSFEGMLNPVNSFDDFMAASAAGSLQAPLPLELSNANLMLWAKANGKTYAEAKEAMAAAHPDFAAPWLSKGHTQKFDEYLRTGEINPGGIQGPSANGARKAPQYWRSSKGESTPETSPVVDTHESKAALLPVGMDHLIQNMTGAQYETVGDFYRDLRHRMDLPHTDQVQAGRWFGGGPITGLKSPRGDRMQGIEDMLLYTAQQTGRDESPAGLRNLWGDVMQGRAFIKPFYGKGGLPIIRR